MHNSYFVLRHLSFRLKELLVGHELISCYSQEKNELIFQFDESGESRFIHLIMRPDLSIIRIPSNLNRARKNSVSLFQEIYNKKVLEVYCFENERCLSIELTSGWQLLIKMFGNQSNVVLCENQKPKVLFKKILKSDLELNPASMNRTILVSKERLRECKGDFTTMLPTLGGAVKKHIEQSGYSALNFEERWSLIQKVLQSLKQPTFYLLGKDSGPGLSMFKPDQHFFYTKDVIEALNEFFRHHVRFAALDNQQKLLLRNLERRKKKATNNLSRYQDRISQLEFGAGYRKKADLIMAYMHKITPGTPSIELPEFTSGKLVTIKLKTSLTPQKNAELLYRKSKNQQKELRIIRQNIKKNQQDLTDIEQHISVVRDCVDPRVLSNYQKEHNLLPDKHKTYKPSQFKEFRFQDYLILIGRNAQNNDMLTQKAAHKDDLWLHAKDVKGSHVVIKHIPGRVYPAFVIERAAQLAAYYSKRKNDTLCPVMYTEKKYVRKPKGAFPGQVVVEREKVLLVTPEAESFRNGNL